MRAVQVPIMLNGSVREGMQRCLANRARASMRLGLRFQARGTTESWCKEPETRGRRTSRSTILGYTAARLGHPTFDASAAGVGACSKRKEASWRYVDLKCLDLLHTTWAPLNPGGWRSKGPSGTRVGWFQDGRAGSTGPPAEGRPARHGALNASTRNAKGRDRRDAP